MASDRSPPEVQTRSKPEKKGITIDSSLIHTATSSSEIENELSGLGVSVYNQGEFEAGVLKQIDDEVHRRNAEQEKKFLLKEYNNIKGEINSVRLDLHTISKTMAGLLSLPLSGVAGRLRELKEAQEQKNKQLKILEAREQAVLKKLTNKDDAKPSTVDPCSSKDLPFGIPASVDENEQRLIQTGQRTPFGSNLETSIATFPSSIVNEEEPTTIELSSDSLNGLFSDGIEHGKELTSRRIARIPKIASSLSGSTADSKSNSKSSSSLEPSIENGMSLGSSLSFEHGNGTSQSFSSGSNSMGLGLDSKPEDELSDHEDWIPSLAEFLESDDTSSESEYITDEELGPGEVEKKKKKKKLRALSSDDDDLSDDYPRKRRRGKGRGLNKRPDGTKKRYNDDGDEDLYQQRISEVDFKCDEREDVSLDGGVKIPGSIWHRLYRYQRTGVKWLWELHCQQAGGIVGDEMGLGKTIQMIAFLAGLKISNLRSHVTRKLGLGPVLIVCPATVMHQWVSEFHSWWPPFRVAVLHGTGTYYGSKTLFIDELVKGDGVVVTTYSGIRLYQDILLRHKWDYVILDEGHKIRNPDAAITLACKQVTTPHRLILSGSPMQNNLRELWSLFDFVFPGKLGTLPIFLEQFSIPITLGGYANASELQVQTAYRCACILRDTINPYMLRRLKADVKIDLPDKHEQVLFCRLTEYQCELYKDYIQSSAVQAMLERGKQVFAGLMALRKLCNHPDLVTNDHSVQVTPWKTKKAKAKRRKGKEEEEEEGEESRLLLGASSGYDPDDEESYGHWRRSGKMIVIESLLKLWKGQKHRVLMFSQSKIMLDIIERFVRGKNYTYSRMDGTTPISMRQSMVNKYNEDESVFVFLLTTRVGGLGINLTGADRVVIYDPDWNPSTDTQARERAWRIGQKRQVTIYRLLTSGTIEEKIYHRQIFKQFLTNRVLKDPRQRRFFKSNSLQELFTLSSSAVEGSTETSAIFAGTGSEIVPTKKSSSSGQGSGRSHNSEEAGRRTRKRKQEEIVERESKRKLRKRGGREKEKESGDPNDRASSLFDPKPDITACITNQPGPSSLISIEHDEEEREGEEEEEREEEVISNHHKSKNKVLSKKGKTKLERVDKKEKRKRKERHRRKSAKIDGERIKGLEVVNTYHPGGEDEEENNKQNDFILQKLFKKSGVHSALQHDTVMNSVNPDYVLVESEASKVAKSAARALKVSRHQCLDMGAGRGRPTWTGLHGVAGAPLPSRFGPKPDAKKMKASSPSLRHFSGSSLPNAKQSDGAADTSSSIILAKMRLRNTLTTSSGEERGVGGASSIHGDAHSELLKEIRDFIATKSKVNGQATTTEILAEFVDKLPHSDSITFRSMLYEICDFSRKQGDGIWYLKEEFK